MDTGWVLLRKKTKIKSWTSLPYVADEFLRKRTDSTLNSYVLTEGLLFGEKTECVVDSLVVSLVIGGNVTPNAEQL